MNRKRDWFLIGGVNLVLVGVLFLSLFISTTTRKSVEITNKDKAIEMSGEDNFEFSFDTNENDIIGIEINCVQMGKPVNQGYVVCELYEENNLIGQYRQALGNVSMRDDVVQLNFGMPVNGQYTIKAHFEEVNIWDSLKVYFGKEFGQNFLYNGKKVSGTISYNYIVENQTHPYVFYVILLFAFANLFLGLYKGGRKDNE